MKNALEQYQSIFFQIVASKERVSTLTWRLPTAVTQCHNLALIYDGEAVFQYNRKNYEVSKGDLVYFEPGVTRTIYNYSKNPVKFFSIDFFYTMPQFHDVWSFKDLSLPFLTVEKINDTYLFQRLCRLYEDFVNLWMTEKFNRNIKCITVMYEIMHLLFLWKFKPDFSYDSIRKLEIIISYMYDNYKNKIYLDDIASLVGITSSYLCNIFKQNLGKTPIEYLILIRIKKACELLQNGYNVSNAAELVGFSDIYYFSKCFKQVEGITPSQYKKSWHINIT